MADSQVLSGVQALTGAVSRPVRGTEPSWYLVSTDHKMIPPDAFYVSQPEAVASLIEQAAQGAFAGKASSRKATSAAGTAVAAVPIGFRGFR